MSEAAARSSSGAAAVRAPGQGVGAGLPPLLDRFGRLHTYVRVSVTDRCNYRCVYCLPPEGLSWMPRDDLLSYEEIARLVRVFAAMGVRRVRLTGGEPLIRRDIAQLVAAVAAVPGVEDLSMTTNAHHLAELAEPLARAGLRRVNVSIDSLDAERFARLTRGGRLDAVLAGIDAARAAGLVPIKLNMVVLRGQNDDEIVPMVERFLPHAADTMVRFIEYMPFEERRHENVPAAEMRARLAERWPVEASEERSGGGPAAYWRVGPMQVGFIAPLTEHFCASCNRLRLLADGHLRTCLGYERTPSLRDLLRGGATDAELADAILAIVRGKPAGHVAETDGGRSFEGVMTAVGG